MRKTMNEILQTQGLCVLATTSGDEPHCSLMAYDTDSSCRNIYLITHQNTKKHRNLKENPRVSLLVDTRVSDKETASDQVQALTVRGSVVAMAADEQVEVVRERFLERHRHLTAFAQHPDAVLMKVRIESLQLLRGAVESYYEEA